MSSQKLLQFQEVRKAPKTSHTSMLKVDTGNTSLTKSNFFQYNNELELLTELKRMQSQKPDESEKRKGEYPIDEPAIQQRNRHSMMVDDVVSELSTVSHAPTSDQEQIQTAEWECHRDIRAEWTDIWLQSQNDGNLWYLDQLNNKKASRLIEIVKKVDLAMSDFGVSPCADCLEEGHAGILDTVCVGAWTMTNENVY